MRFKISTFVLLSAPFRWVQKLIIHQKLKKVDLTERPPVFIVGHWRSGTTHLHYLLTKDQQFSFLTAFQAFFFHVAFVSKAFMKPLLHKMMPSTRPQDNVKIDSNAPTEEEHPLVNCTEKSGMHSFFFPRNWTYFDKYNLFKGTNEEEIKIWKKAYNRVLKKIALFEGSEKRLLLKNPHNTGRLKVLMEMYPDSKFIYIHRNPYEVFTSTRTLYNKTIKSQFLQELDDIEIDDRILYAYEKTLKKYLSDKEIIPRGQLIEVAYTELDKNPMKVLEKIYDELELGDFEQVGPMMEKYLAQLGRFKKNNTVSIPDHILEQINKRWGFAFKEWDYEMRSLS
jgi:hypothetical protein